MARIIENDFGKRSVLLSTDDIISVVKEYQTISSGCKNYEDVRNILKKKYIFLPEEFI